MDSDDMYHKNAIEEIQSCKLEKRKGLLYNKGYVLFHESPSLYRRIKWKIGKLITKLK